ncbi:hypothetical protein, partial [Acinetobacter baumannii]|uniref:hypothetical protein n=1 Tax=Acinetobacter baumannii TaxID=470 RepID=UPI001C08C51F
MKLSCSIIVGLQNVMLFETTEGILQSFQGMPTEAPWLDSAGLIPEDSIALGGCCTEPMEDSVLFGRELHALHEKSEPGEEE